MCLSAGRLKPKKTWTRGEQAEFTAALASSVARKFSRDINERIFKTLNVMLLQPKQTHEERLRGRALGVWSKVRAQQRGKTTIECPERSNVQFLSKNMYAALAASDDGLIGESVERDFFGDVCDGKIEKVDSREYTVHVKYTDGDEEDIPVENIKSYDVTKQRFVAEAVVAGTASNNDQDVNEMTTATFESVLKTLCASKKKPQGTFSLCSNVRPGEDIQLKSQGVQVSSLSGDERMRLSKLAVATKEFRELSLKQFREILRFGKEDVKGVIRQLQFKEDEKTSEAESLKHAIMEVIEYRRAADDSVAPETISTSFDCSAGEQSLRLLQQYVQTYCTWDWMLRRHSEKTEDAYLQRLRNDHVKWCGGKFGDTHSKTLQEMLTKLLKDLNIFNWDVINTVDISEYDDAKLKEFVSELDVATLRREVQLRQTQETTMKRRKRDLVVELLQLLQIKVCNTNVSLTICILSQHHDLFSHQCHDNTLTHTNTHTTRSNM